ncbi:hypothetical protein J2Z40_001759 [Cytobacillus eiseniae]|uniref:Sporulation protein n=1 Tax=Cytobacillus eiseniae TaxID=762947 RepID=A0ABS4RE72_9BACI|nr:DUF1360 domain-containing protein [Cytobacillus eiseniae]MBP2241197.1 hypothetical protein [Cytobacillus eiseniae]
MYFSFMELLILAFASFRFTRLLVYDQITEFMRKPFFDEVQETTEEGVSEEYYVPKTGLRGFFGQLLSCYWCTGIWSSLFLCLFYLYFPEIAIPFLLVLAVAGLAAIIETVVQKWLDE